MVRVWAPKPVYWYHKATGYGSDFCLDSHESTYQEHITKNIPTWSAYNSILADETPTDTHGILPIIQGTTTDWSICIQLLQHLLN